MQPLHQSSKVQYGSNRSYRGDVIKLGRERSLMKDRESVVEQVA